MLDIKFIRENVEVVKKAARDKAREVDIDRLLELDKKRRRLIGEIDEKREERNRISNFKFQISNKILMIKFLKRLSALI